MISCLLKHFMASAAAGHAWLVGKTHQHYAAFCACRQGDQNRLTLLALVARNLQVYEECLGILTPPPDPEER